MVRPPRLELGCTRRAPLKRGCLPFHHGRPHFFFEVRTFGRIIFELEDQVGLEPTVTCVDGLRIRSLGRWGHWSMIGGSGWFRTTCARVKRPLHLQSGLTLRIRRLDGCGGKPRRFRVARRDSAAPRLRACQRGLALRRRLDLHLLASCCIFSRQASFGDVCIDGSPVRNRTCVNRLSTGRTATVLRDL